MSGVSEGARRRHHRGHSQQRCEARPLGTTPQGTKQPRASARRRQHTLGEGTGTAMVTSGRTRTCIIGCCCNTDSATQAAAPFPPALPQHCPQPAWMPCHSGRGTRPGHVELVVACGGHGRRRHTRPRRTPHSHRQRRPPRQGRRSHAAVAKRCVLGARRPRDVRPRGLRTLAHSPAPRPLSGDGTRLRGPASHTRVRPQLCAQVANGAQRWQGTGTAILCPHTHRSLSPPPRSTTRSEVREWSQRPSGITRRQGVVLSKVQRTCHAVVHSRRRFVVPTTVMPNHRRRWELGRTRSSRWAPCTSPRYQGAVCLSPVLA